MSLRSLLAKQFAKKIYKKTQKWVKNPVKTQDSVFQNLISKAVATQFGKDHERYDSGSDETAHQQ